jgi:hypothetical protein
VKIGFCFEQQIVWPFWVKAIFFLEMGIKQNKNFVLILKKVKKLKSKKIVLKAKKSPIN